MLIVSGKRTGGRIIIRRLLLLVVRSGQVAMRELRGELGIQLWENGSELGISWLVQDDFLVSRDFS